MWINFVVLVLLFATYILLDSKEHNGALSIQKSKKHMIRVSGILLILQSGLRNVAVGPDTYAYYLKFVDSLSVSWQEIHHNFFRVYIVGEGKDAGYYFIQKLFSSIIPNFQCFLLFIAVVFFYAFLKFIDKYTSSKTEVFLGVFLYLALFYEFFSITGCRQVLATALCIFSVGYVRERKIVPFMLIMLAAFTVHRSSLIFIPFYFVSINKKPGIVYIIALILMPLLIAVSVRYANELVILSGTDLYLMYAEGGASGARNFLLFYVSITTFLFAIQKKIIKNNSDDILIYNAVYVALLFIPLTYSSAALMRVVQYYSLFLTIGITFFLRKNLKKNNNTIATLFLVLSLIALTYKLINNDIEYKFFWQEMELPMNYL